jgi:hypothetical protein
VIESGLAVEGGSVTEWAGVGWKGGVLGWARLQLKVVSAGKIRNLSGELV